MQIDWFTTAAQAVNFLILIWLLKKFLYRPVQTTLRQRTADIAERNQAATDRMQEAELAKQHYQQEKQNLQQQQAEHLALAQQQIEQERAEKLQLLDEEIRQKRAQFAQNLETEKQAQNQLIQQTITDQALHISQKILSDLSDRSLEQQIIKQFIEHLSDLPKVEKEKLKHAIKLQDSITVSSHFVIDAATQKTINTELNALTKVSEIDFKQRPDLLCGIALEAGGQTWEWHINRYLNDLKHALKAPS